MVGLVLAGLVLITGGCALPLRPVSTAPHLPAEVPIDVPAGRYRLGVGHFTDARPRADREPHRPPLRVQWHGLVRRGEIQTGDRSFDGPIDEGVRRDAIATLARSGAFAQVRAIDVGDADATRRAAADDLDLVLVATIEELVGIQRQDFAFSFILIGGIWNRFEEPIGLARVHYRLYDANGLVFENRIDTSHQSAVRTLAQAALDAVARSNERLAQQLFLRLVPEEARVRRTVPVRVVDRCSLGKARVEHLVGRASAVFEREAGVRLGADWVSSPAPALSNLETGLRAARTQEPPPGGAVLWLVYLDSPNGDRRFGLSVPLGEHAVVVCDPGGDARTVTLAHEIAHLFGAVHVEDRSSVMHPVAEFDGRFFDPLNRRIVRAAWDRPFGAPLSKRIRRELGSIYRAALRVSAVLEPEEVDTLLAALDSGG
jgi:hypothetical protein